VCDSGSHCLRRLDQDLQSAEALRLGVVGCWWHSISFRGGGSWLWVMGWWGAPLRAGEHPAGAAGGGARGFFRTDIALLIAMGGMKFRR
jgi:hypothetical protein